MPTLILPPRYTPDSIALWKTAIKAKWEVIRLQNWKIPEHLEIRAPVLYGEPLFADVVAEGLSIILIEPPPNWLVTLPKKYLNREIIYTTLSAARKLQKPAFIKPAIDKCFPAKVYQSVSELPSNEILPGSTPILISEPVIWEIEFRCFIKEGHLMTISPYLDNGNLACDRDGNWYASELDLKEAKEFCQKILIDKAVKIPPAVVIDVGKITGFGWSIVEANSAWGSGIYGCDRFKVLSTIKRACIARDK